MSQYSLSVLCHFVALADCIRSGYVSGQLVITHNILSFYTILFFDFGRYDYYYDDYSIHFVLGVRFGKVAILRCEPASRKHF